MSKKILLTREYLEEEYIIKKQSTYDIALKHNISPTTVRRALLKNGIEIRDHSKAQTIVLNTKFHPTRGQERSNSVKEAIADSIKLRRNNGS